MTSLSDWIASILGKDTALNSATVAAIVSAFTSAVVAYLSKRFELRDKLSAEYEHEQRKRLRELIGRYHGRLTFAASSLNNRMWNLYKNAHENWHSSDSPDEPGYYLASLTHRFLTLQALMRQVEAQAIVLDGRIATPKDYNFLKYIRLTNWVMTDVALFQGLKYDKSKQKDHFFSDNLREYAERFVVGEAPMTLPQLREDIKQSQSFHPVLQFFRGISQDEDRLRWDRIVALHLVLLAFLNSFGTDLDQSEDHHFTDAAIKLNHPQILRNLAHWIGRHKLDKDPGARRITALAHCEKARTQAPTEGAPNQDET
ncbi:hypothetical protein WMF04_04865 [Sorangium sp. So ce260]|uniref:hypothetical protein n=1 Tax=Sorangium sp. So ce260 TaxID=3133291 RepID=UPI003F63EE5A